MQDRTSYSYRGDRPGSNPDMYSQGGKARDAFKQARCSPYVRQESQKQKQKQGSAAPNKEQFKANRKAPAPALKPTRSR